MQEHPRRFELLCLPILLLTLSSTLCADPPSVTYFYPSGAQRGKTVEVTASGTFPNWPLQVQVTTSGLQFEAAKDKGKFKAVIDAEAQVGVHFIRLYDAAGASSLHPFFVSDLPEIVEAEPNDQPSAPQVVDNRIIINGKLAKGGDVDGYRISLKSGQTVVASMMANRTLKSPMDSVLQVCDAAGFVIDQNDDELGFDPQLVFTAPRDGDYLFRTFAFPATPNSTIGFAGADNYVYRLTLTTGPYLDHTLPLAVHRDTPTKLQLVGWNLSPDQTSQTVEPPGEPPQLTIAQPQTANPLSLPVTPHAIIASTAPTDPNTPTEVPIPSVITGNIAAPKQVHVYQFHAAKDAALLFRVEGRQLGYRIDPWLGVKDVAGKLLKEVDDAKDRGADIELSWKAPAEGDYQLHIRDLHGHGGARYVYRLTVTEPQPDFQLSFTADTGIVAPDKPLEVTVNIARQGGLNDPIEIGLAELPDGVQCTPVISAAKGDSAKSVKLKITTDGTKAFQGSLQIVGKSQADPPTERTAHFAVGDGVLIRDFWLTALPKP